MSDMVFTTMVMELTSFGPTEFGPADHTGKQNAIGRYWSFMGDGFPGIIDLFVASPGAPPEPVVGTRFEIVRLQTGPDPDKLGLIGFDRKNDRLYRIAPMVQDPGAKPVNI